MGHLAFSLVCCFLAAALYAVVRTYFRSRKSFPDLLKEIKPLSPRLTELIWKSTQEATAPPTWINVSDLYYLWRNSTVFTMAADRFRRLTRNCRDEEVKAECSLTLRTFLRSHWGLTKSLLRVLLYLCFGRIGRPRCCIAMASVALNYGSEVLMVQEMTEVVDDPSGMTILEGQLLHGS